MACELCTDPDRVVLVPYYGLAPHTHELPAGLGFGGSWVIGSTRFLSPDQFPPNFKPDPESPNHGTWWCEHCGEGKPEDVK